MHFFLVKAVQGGHISSLWQVWLTVGIKKSQLKCISEERDQLNYAYSNLITLFSSRRALCVQTLE